MARTTIVLALMTFIACDDPSGGDGGGGDAVVSGGSLTPNGCGQALAEFVACGGELTGSWQVTGLCMDRDWIDSHWRSAGEPAGTVSFADGEITVDLRGGPMESLYSFLKEGNPNDICDASCTDAGAWCNDCRDTFGALTASDTSDFRYEGPAAFFIAGGVEVIPGDTWDGADYTFDFCITGDRMVMRDSDHETLIVLRR